MVLRIVDVEKRLRVVEDNALSHGTRFESVPHYGSENAKVSNVNETLKASPMEPLEDIKEEHDIKGDEEEEEEEEEPPITK